MQSPRFSAYLSKVLADIVELRDLFERQFTRTLNITNQISLEYEQFVNDDLNNDIKNLVVEMSKFTVKRIKEEYDQTKNVELRTVLYLILVISYEKNGAAIPFYKTIGQFIDGVWKKEISTIESLVMNLMKRI